MSSTIWVDGYNIVTSSIEICNPFDIRFEVFVDVHYLGPSFPQQISIIKLFDNMCIYK